MMRGIFLASMLWVTAFNLPGDAGCLFRTAIYQVDTVVHIDPVPWVSGASCEGTFSLGEQTIILIAPHHSVVIPLPPAVTSAWIEFRWGQSGASVYQEYKTTRLPAQIYLLGEI